MAVTLPTFADVGVNDPRSVGSQPSYPANDPVAEGTAALGKGIEKVGGAIADYAADQQRTKDKLEQALATTDLFNRLTPLHEQISKETDPAKLSELRGQYNTLLPTSGAGISDPYARKLWEATHSKTIAQAHADADARNTVLDRNQAVAQIAGLTDRAARTGAAADDSQAFESAKLAIKNTFDWGQQYGALLPTQRYELEKRALSDLVTGRIDSLIAKGRVDEASTLLEQNRTDLGAEKAGNLEIKLQNKSDGIATDTAANRALGMAPRGGGSADGVSLGQMKTLAENAGFRGADADKMAAIAMIESSGNPRAHNPDGEDSYGLTQINARAHGDIAKEAFGNPQRAFELAKMVYDKQGWDAWRNSLEPAQQQYLAKGPIQAEPIGSSPPKINGAGKAIPDSLVSGTPAIEVWGDSLGVGLKGQLKSPGKVHGGDTPTTILSNIKAQPEDSWQGKTVVLPSGSNGNEMPVVEDTIKYLKDKGATVVAVGYGPKFTDKNAELAKIAQRQGVQVVAAEDVAASEGVHPSPNGYKSMAGKIAGIAAKPIPTDVSGARAQAIPTDVSRATPQLVQTGPNRTGLPTLAEIEQNIQADPSLKNDRQRDIAFNKAKTKYSAFEADAARAERIAAAQQKQAVEARVTAIQRDAYSDRPTITARDIVNDPTFDGDHKLREHMIGFVNNPPGSGVPAPQSYAAAQSMIDRMRLPFGNENKITDKNQIYDQMRLLNREDLNFVLGKFDELSSPGTNRFGQRLEKFFTDLTPQIDRSGALPSLPNDMLGKARSFQFRRAVEDQVDEYRKAGKNPDDLINPKKPDYMGAPETLKPYKRTISEALADFTNEMGGGEAAAKAFGPASAVDLSKLGSLADMQAAVKKDPSLRDRAIAISIERGWIAPPAAPGPAIAPPIAQP